MADLYNCSLKVRRFLTTDGSTEIFNIVDQELGSYVQANLGLAAIQALFPEFGSSHTRYYKGDQVLFCLLGKTSTNSIYEITYRLREKLTGIVFNLIYKCYGNGSTSFSGLQDEINIVTGQLIDDDIYYADVTNLIVYPNPDYVPNGNGPS